jgi:hypothetical protein
LDEAKLLAETLRSTLEVLNPLGVEIILNTMERICGVVCSAQSCSSKEQIEQGLVCVLGQDAGQVIIREWNKKMSKS